MRGSARTRGVRDEARTEAERGAGGADAAPDRSSDGARQKHRRRVACKEADVSEQSYYRWRKEYGGLQIDQARRMKDLERENARLRRLVADLSLEKQVLKDVASGNL